MNRVPSPVFALGRGRWITDMGSRGADATITETSHHAASDAVSPRADIIELRGGGEDSFAIRGPFSGPLLLADAV